MSLYFFHLRNGHDVLLDPEGRELDGIEAITSNALKEARSIISEDARDGCIYLDQSLDIRDEAGLLVHRLEFPDAVEIVQPKG